ncbi:hypothetical protein BDN72DRAFT_842083, partial [Pluteus cervinus]
VRVDMSIEYCHLEEHRSATCLIRQKSRYLLHWRHKSWENQHMYMRDKGTSQKRGNNKTNLTGKNQQVAARIHCKLQQVEFRGGAPRTNEFTKKGDNSRERREPLANKLLDAIDLGHRGCFLRDNVDKRTPFVDYPDPEVSRRVGVAFAKRKEYM